MYRISGSYPAIRPIFHYLVSGLLLNYPVSGRISYWYLSGRIPDNCTWLYLADKQYQARYLLLSGLISSIIWPDIRLGNWPDIWYYPAGYPVRQLAGYPVAIRLSSFVSISRISGYPAKSLSGTSLIFNTFNVSLG